MNKQELIEKIRALPYDEGVSVDTLKINRAGLIQLIEQFDEPQKVTIPQFVADWIKYCKNTGVTLVRALLVEEIDLYNYANQKDYKKLKEFLKVKDNQEAFACAWLDGYTVEKEPKYTVKIKGKIEENLLVYGWGIKRYFFARTYNDSSKRGEHTRKELEEDGFGWVFDCPGIDIEEVE